MFKYHIIHEIDQWNYFSSTTPSEDKGYGSVIDSDNIIYLTGTLNHSSQGFNIFLAKFDTNLNQLKNMTLNDPWTEKMSLIHSS